MFLPFVIYNKTTGDISVVGACSHGDLAGQPYDVATQAMLVNATADLKTQKVDVTAVPPVVIDIPVSAAQQLANAQASKLEDLWGTYSKTIQTDVSFTTAAGVTKTFQADNAGEDSSQSVLLKAFTGYNALGAVPSGFFWKSSDNTKVPFTLADLGGLYGAMLQQGWTAYQHLQNKKTEVEAASTVADVEAVTW